MGGPPLDVPKALQLIGPPPRTQLGKVQTKQVLAPQAPEDPNAVLLGLDAGDGNHGAIVNALSQQSNALTALVAHFANQSSDCLTDLQSGFSTSSSMKGVQRREKLQSELASRTGNFFLLLMQQIHKKLTPGEHCQGRSRKLGRSPCWSTYRSPEVTETRRPWDLSNGFWAMQWMPLPKTILRG